LLLAIVALQRLSVPAGSGYVSLVLIVALVVLGALLLGGAVVEDRGRVIAYLTAATACVVAALAVGVRGAPVSMTSLGLLCVAYLPFCFSLRERYRVLAPELLRFFTAVMTLIAVVAVVEFAAQLIGRWHYTDLLAGIVPQKFLVPGYSTTYPIHYGSAIYKSNAIVMLEPSVCSQFLALAIIAQLLLGGGRGRIALYLTALVTTVSGTGLVVLAVGIGVEVLRRGLRFAAAMGALGAVALAVVLATPLGHVYSQRSREISTRSSSAHQRFIEPYTHTWDVIGRSDAALLEGDGPGSADRDNARFIAFTQLPRTSPPLTKLVDEYGLPAGGLFAWFVLYVVTVGVPSSTLSAALVVWFFTLSAGALLAAHTIFTCWLLSSIFARPRPVPVASVLVAARYRRWAADG